MKSLEASRTSPAFLSRLPRAGRLPVDDGDVIAIHHVKRRRDRCKRGRLALGTIISSREPTAIFLAIDAQDNRPAGGLNLSSKFVHFYANHSTSIFAAVLNGRACASDFLPERQIAAEHRV